MYRIEYGELICPNYQYKGMNKYTFWSSRIINEYTKQWLFYNKIEKRRGWKCWSIFELCSKKINNWYDPWGCCFNPCSGNTGLCVGLLKILFIYFLFGFIYLGYIFLFLWFDIFYCFCYKQKFYQILMPNGGDKTIPIKEGLWKNFETAGYTDFFWEDNFPNLFKCKRCCCQKRTFYEFLRKGGNMVVINNQDSEPQIVNTTDSPSFPQ